MMMDRFSYLKAFYCFITQSLSRDSVVGIAIGYGLDD
jgi:hypothetical protein